MESCDEKKKNKKRKTKQKQKTGQKRLWRWRHELSVVLKATTGKSSRKLVFI